MRRRRKRTFLEGFPVLVLDGHARAALETVQSLGRRGAHVEVAAESGAAPAFLSRFAAARSRQPRGTAVLAAWIERRVEAGGARLVVPATETSLLALLSLPEGAPARRAAVLAPAAALALALDKERTWQAAREIGVPVPARTLLPQGTRVDATLPPAAGFPVVLKPIHSKAVVRGRLETLAPAVVRNEAERRQRLAAWLPLTAIQEQAYVSGCGQGVEVLYEHGRLRWAFAHERLHEWPLTGGGSTYRRSIAVPADLLAATRALLEPLAWHGVAMVEFKRAPDGSFSLMEINPRLWGSLALAIDAGVDFPLGLAALAAGIDPGPQPRVRVGLATRHLAGDVPWLLANLRAPRTDPLLLLRPRAGSLVEPLRHLLRRDRFDHGSFLDPRPLREEALHLLRATGRRLAGVAATQAFLHRERRLQRRRFRALVGAERPPQHVLVLCYGNICRSPLAAAALARARPDLEIVSAGFHAKAGRRSPLEMEEAAAAVGLDLTGHRSRSVLPEDVERADLVLVMDRENLEQAYERFPGARPRTVWLGIHAPRRDPTIADPYGRGLLAAAAAAGEIVAAVEALVARLPSKPK